MHAMLVLAALLAQPAEAPPPLPPAASPFGGLFTDWRAANAQSLEQERSRDSAANAPARTAAEARALGDRVGRIVAEGACEEGERVAREAGDFALVRAVQDHCRRIPAGQLPAWAQPQ
ncbi:MAG: hypothetical protein ACK4SZ_17225 [Allosphingosinicella sp.]|uniref:hypothetical protein n=1 Tax=Allosphingosinicella sp. TaxID=2823234 RepID=UPI00392EE92F